MYFLLKMGIFHCYVRLPECKMMKLHPHLFFCDDGWVEFFWGGETWKEIHFQKLSPKISGGNTFICTFFWDGVTLRAGDLFESFERWQGSLNSPFLGGSKLMQMSGNFDGFPL